MDKSELLGRIDRAWTGFTDSIAGLSDAQMTDTKVTSIWTVKDIVAHVTWWEEEALKYLPLLAMGGRPPKYSQMYGGLDAFNALMTEERRRLPLAQVLAQSRSVHERLVAYVASAPDELTVSDTPFRKRLRLDTYGHYPLHAKALRAWREAQDR